MRDRIVGTCGNCGGEVAVPTVWMGVNPPTPQCLQCHSLAEPTGPTMKMRPRPQPPRDLAKALERARAGDGVHKRLGITVEDAMRARRVHGDGDGSDPRKN